MSTPFLISPPFGNWVGAPNCTRVLGSFTWQPRPGLIKQTLRTLRPVPGGWVNQIGLRNRGIRSVAFDDNCIYSLVGLDDGDWERMLDHCPEGLRVEVNLGCPNVHRYGIQPDVLAAFCAKFRVIAKLSPLASHEQVALCAAAGVTHLHLCNTLPSPRGGISGRQLREPVSQLIQDVAATYPDMTIIAGGGIYSLDDVRHYETLGASHYSLSTIWFSPWRVPPVLRFEPSLGSGQKWWR